MTKTNLKTALAKRALDWIVPDWPAPANVRALATTRNGGASRGVYASMNLGAHVGDDAQAVEANRSLLAAVSGAHAAWLRQVHGAHVVEVTSDSVEFEADAAVTSEPGVAPSVLVADCLPVLFCDRGGSVVAAAHGGWRGLAAGVLENTVRAMGAAPQEVLAWLGPAIGACVFEVGADVHAAFCAPDARASDCFVRHSNGKWLADLHSLARMRLSRVGVDAVFGGGACTFSEPDRFYSFRRDRTTGRMAALVWLES